MPAWSQEEDQVVRNLHGQKTQQDIARLLGRTKSMVHNRVKTLKLPNAGHGKSRMSRKKATFFVDDNFFASGTERSAYWAGFIAADGCIRNNRVTIRLAVKDVEHLEIFKKDISFTGEILRFMEKGGEVCSISFSSEKVVSDLLEMYSITPRKSLTLKPPRITDDRLIRAFIVGITDGDGCILLTKKKTTARIVQSPRLSICSGSHEMILWIGTTLKTISQDSKLRVYKCQGKKLWQYSIGHGPCLRVIDALRGVDVPRLDRKWGKVISVPPHRSGYTTMGIEKLKPVRKLTADNIHEMRSLFLTEMTNIEIGKRFGVTGARVGQIKRQHIKDSDSYVDIEEAS